MTHSQACQRALQSALDAMRQADLENVQMIGGYPAIFDVVFQEREPYKIALLVVECGADESGKPYLAKYQVRHVNRAFLHAMRDFKSGEFDTIGEAMRENWPDQWEEVNP